MPNICDSPPHFILEQSASIRLSWLDCSEPVKSTVALEYRWKNSSLNLKVLCFVTPQALADTRTYGLLGNLKFMIIVIRYQGVIMPEVPLRKHI